jgi:hypothetical protein
MKSTFFALLILLVGCNSNGKDTSQNNNLHPLVIQERCAIIYWADSLKILDLKKKDENGFYVAADDAMFYISKARTFLDSNNVKVIETDSRIIDFYTNDKLLKRVDLNSNDKYWGVILFNGSNVPLEVGLTNIESEFEKIK